VKKSQEKDIYIQNSI